MLAYITSLAAAVAVLIAFLQWRTAQTKVALDVFETRYEIYKELREVVAIFSRDFNFSNELHAKYMEAQSHARFHFGAEVEQYLEELRRDLIRGHYFERYARDVANEDEHVARLNRIATCYSEIDRMFTPYMRLDQRMPLWWWPTFSKNARDRISSLRARLKTPPAS